MNQQSLLRYYSKKTTEPKKFSQDTYMVSQQTDQMHIENELDEEYDEHEHDPWSGPTVGLPMNDHSRINPHTSFIPTTGIEKIAEYSLPIDAFADNKHNNHTTKSLFDYYHLKAVPKSLNVSPVTKKPLLLSQTSIGEQNQQQVHHYVSKQTSLSQWLSKNEINPVANKW